MATNEIVENTEVYKQLESIFPDIKKKKQIMENAGF